MTDREKFEKWARNHGYDVEVLTGASAGQYMIGRTQTAWLMWQSMAAEGITLDLKDLFSWKDDGPRAVYLDEVLTLVRAQLPSVKVIV